jgi:RNA polymerase sigma-70 factor (ECF subfamily)
LEKDSIRAVTPERGRFRSFLLTAFKHFLNKEWDKARTQKRGGGRLPISLDFPSADPKLRLEPTGGLTPEQFYDRQWALTLLGRIMERLKAEFQENGRSDTFDGLKEFIIGDPAGQRYADAAARLAMSEVAARKTVSRMRQRYRELLRMEIAQTVGGPGEVEQEIRNLFAILSEEKSGK